MVWAFILFFSTLASAGTHRVLVNRTEKSSAGVRIAEPAIPGKFSEKVKPTFEQKKGLSPQADFFIHGGMMAVSKEQILQMRASRIRQPVGSIIGTNQTTVNDREFWSENVNSFYTTQNETSSAVYGKHIVAGWNDYETFYAYTSACNWAVSHDGGVTFQARLGLPTDVTITATLGNPSIAVDPQNGRFYYSTLAQVTDSGTDYVGVVLYESSDFGDTLTWTMARFPGDPTEFYDKPLLAVDPSNGKVYVSLTYLSNNSPFYSILLWNATDGFLTTVISSDLWLQGSMPAVGLAGLGPDHALYVAYEAKDGDGNPSIKIKKSTDFGMSFGDEVNVHGPFMGAADNFHDPSPTQFCGGYSAIRGNIKVNEFPVLAINMKTSGGGAGNLYIAFNARDPVTRYLDVYLTRSVDGGVTWSTPIRANPRPAGDESDKFFPWVTVNGMGKVGLIYYEKKRTPGVSGFSNNNWWIFANVRRFTPGLILIDSVKTSPEFPVIVNNDYTPSCSMGMYNSISANRKGVGDDNFFAFWSDNRFGDPDIQFSKVVPY